jgi:hemolysin III
MDARARREEAASAVTHGLGIALSVAGGATLIVMAALSGSAWKIVGTSVFALSLILLYTASTVYHSVHRETLRSRLQIIDHCAIYVLIAGTYTPFMLDGMRGPWGWSLFGVIWGLACAGVAFKLFFTGRFQRTSTLIYIAMGWLVIIAARPLVQSIDRTALAWLVAGGLAYTAGTLFYLSRRLPFAHAVWHVFVLAGSVCHGIAVGVTI